MENKDTHKVMVTIIKGLILTNAVLFILLVASNMYWLSQNKEYKEPIEIRVESKEGGNAVLNGEGEVYINGKSMEDEDSAEE